MGRREEELNRAVIIAAELLEKFPVGNRSSFDIVEAVTVLGIPLYFRKLEGLLGAVIPVDEDLTGVIVTTERDLAIQRFTLAHELGHVLLGHQHSFDGDGDIGTLGQPGKPLHEEAADMFAAELLGAKRLVLNLARRHQWTRIALKNGMNVYQLALRLGISFQAACWALVNIGVLKQSDARCLLEIKVKGFKLALAPKDFIIDPWANVWRLTEGDGGLSLEAGPNDLFVAHMVEDPSSGYRWSLAEGCSGCSVVYERSGTNGDGGVTSYRDIFFRIDKVGRHRVVLENRCPWAPTGSKRIDLEIDNQGKESKGIPRRKRAEALSREAALA